MTTRRNFLVAAGGIGIGPGGTAPARATPAALQGAIRELVGDAPVRPGKVVIDLPPLVDNGNVVALAVAVESPMTPDDYVASIHVFAQKNPQPYVIAVALGPRAGRARFATRIRLADTQTITAIARLGDGSFWSATQDVVVTTAACAEELS